MNVNLSNVILHNKYNYSEQDKTFNYLKSNQLRKDSVFFTSKIDKQIIKVLKDEKVSYTDITHILENIAYPVEKKSTGSHKLYTFDPNLDFSTPQKGDEDKFITLTLGKKDPPKYLLKQLKNLLNLAGYELTPSGSLTKPVKDEIRKMDSQLYNVIPAES